VAATELSIEAEGSSADALIAALEAHPQARAVLSGAFAAGSAPSHAYLFHGPAGTGKRAAARAFATLLLAEGARDPAGVGERVAREAHPDLTWVRPSGSGEMLVGDIEQAVVGAAARTPFESARRVFVIEGVETMNDQAANRMLKTLEEPPAFVHLVLITERREEVLATISSRCLHVRFDPLAPSRIAAALEEQAGPEGALACARLAQGDAGLAAMLAGERGQRLRAGAQAFVRSAIAGRTEGRAWMELLEIARGAAGAWGERAQESLAAELEMLPSKERKRHEREGADARRRGERRARMGTLDEGLRLSELWLRDMLCLCEGAPELILAVDRRGELARDAEQRSPARLAEAIELVGNTRLALRLNVSEELALEALAYRLQGLLAA
jgi:DNA polymerase-3 subunit delta'